MSKHYDLIWIGTGQATMSIVPRILAVGKTVAIVEGAAFGGTCVNNGCTPTKTLVAAAKAISQAQRGEDFGFSIDNLQVDFEKVMAPQKTSRKRATANIAKRLDEHENSTVYEGYAEFSGPNSIIVGDESLSADHIVISVGTRPRQPNVPGIDSVDWLDNQKILDLTELPEHLAIVGGSYIGLEFAQIFRRLGSRVTVFERGPQLMAREDADIAAIADDVLSSEGIDVVYNSQVEALSPENGITVSYSAAEQKNSLQASHILFAIGRQPNSDRLNLEAAGIEMDGRGFVEVNESVQTNREHIYAIGDVNGKGAFTHTSVNDGEIFWDHYSRLHGINDETPELDRTLPMRTIIYSMFIDPPLARIGINEKEARSSQRKVLMATMPMSNISRAIEKQETKGLVKIFVDADSEQILGATVFGTGGDEVIGVFAPFIQTKSSYKLFRRAIFPHPTVGELMPWVLDKLEPLQ